MENFKREIFEHLGNVFYAVALEQGVSNLQSGELKMLFRKDWVAGSEDRPEDKVSEPAHVIGLVIDSLQSDRVAASKAFDSFEKFFRAHQEQFSMTLKENIKETVQAILKIFPASGKKNIYAERVAALMDAQSTISN
jgi:primosomal protein N'